MLGSPVGNLLDIHAEPLCKLAIRWLLADPYANLRSNSELAFPRFLLERRDSNGVVMSFGGVRMGVGTMPHRQFHQVAIDCVT